MHPKGCKLVINVAFYKSLIGILKIYSTDYALRKIELVKEINDFECSEFNYSVIEQLEAYFQGKLHTFNIPVELPYATVFHKKVYDELLKIGYGKTVTYKELAVKAGSPNASRAVGTAMAKNPVPLIIPCHRVINSNGKTGNYSLGDRENGKDTKIFLLDFEKSHC